MALKVNLKKYLKIEGRWQFVAVLRVNGLPKPAYVVLNGEPVKETAGEFYLDWRSDGRRHQVPCGSDPESMLSPLCAGRKRNDGLFGPRGSCARVRKHPVSAETGS